MSITQGRKKTHITVPATNDEGLRPGRYRIAYARPYKVAYAGGGHHATEAAARTRAQQLADRDGCPVPILDEANRRYLRPEVQPAEYRCQNRDCGTSLSEADFVAHWATFRCPTCPPPGSLITLHFKCGCSRRIPCEEKRWRARYQAERQLCPDCSGEGTNSERLAAVLTAGKDRVTA